MIERLAVIGNSHVACLKQGWDRVAEEFASIRITFFAARASGLLGLGYENGRLVPRNKAVGAALSATSGGKEEINLGEFDALLIYGAGFDAAIWPDKHRFSLQAQQRALRDSIEGTTCAHILGLLKNRYHGRIFVGHCPLHGLKGPSRPSDNTIYHQALVRIQKEILAPWDARLIPQPEETIVLGARTDIQYCRGAVRLSVGLANDGHGFDAEDRTHMNGDFGELWLCNFFRVVETGEFVDESKIWKWLAFPRGRSWLQKSLGLLGRKNAYVPQYARVARR